MRPRQVTALFMALAIFAATLTALVPPRLAFGAETTFTANNDATIKSGLPNQNFGSDSILDINDTRDGLVKFDLSSIPASATINSATLNLKVTAINGSNERTYSVHRVLSGWSEGTVTWNDPGSSSGTNFAASATASQSMSSTGTYGWNVTADVSAFVSTSASNHGWRVLWTSNASGTNKQIEIGSRENGGNEPTLTVNYTESDSTAPASVSNLAGTAASTTSFTVTWTAPGDDGSTGTASTYDLRYSTAAITDGNFSSASAAIGEPTPGAAGSSQTASISGLSINTRYYLALKSSDEVPNTSSLSNAPSAYTLANPPASAPFGSTTSSSIVADWVGNSNPSQTEYYAENQTASTNSGWIADTVWTSSSLQSETSYTYRVKARSGDGTETAWVSLGSQSTSASSGTSGAATTTSSSASSATSATTSAATATATSSVPAATGPTIAAPVVAPPPSAAVIGAPGTTTPDTNAGETTTQIPILPTEGDTTAPNVTFTESPEVTDSVKVTLAGQASEEKGKFSGVIEGLAYSLDSGKSWHPVSSTEGLGQPRATFSIVTPTLPDGTYRLTVRARDNSGNEGQAETGEVTIDQLPVIFGSTVFLTATGDALGTADPAVAAGTSLRFIAALEGGVTHASLQVGEQEMTLSPDAIQRRFGTIIAAENAGSYPLQLQANDGAGHALTKNIGTLTVLPALMIRDSAARPLPDATVTLEIFDVAASVWRRDSTPGQINPQPTRADGTVSLQMREGTYRLRAKAPGHWYSVTEALTLTNPAALTGELRLPRRPWYQYILPVRTYPLPLPSDNILAINEPQATDLTKELSLSPRDLSNTERPLDEFAGHRLLLTTVTGWNRTSQEQLSILQRLQDDIGKDVTIIPWLVQQPARVLSGLLQRGQYSLTGFADPSGEDTEPLGRTIVPTHFVFDRAGKLRATRAGFATTHELIELLSSVQ